MRARILIAAILAISYGEDQFIEGQPGPGMVAAYMITLLRAKYKNHFSPELALWERAKYKYLSFTAKPKGKSWFNLVIVGYYSLQCHQASLK